MRSIGLLPTFTVCLAAQDSKSAVFPALEADNLNKQKLQLPGDLAGDLNLLLIGFQREQQTDIDTWLAPLPGVVIRHPNLAYYELPVIDRTNFMLRWVINTGMRGGIPDKQQRARTVTLYLDKKPFRAALQIESENTIHALLINKKGEVMWRAQGRADEGKLESLEAFLRMQ
ncbi:MAG: hypothetical protein ABIR70_22745 [Bryobacteraceae bacterium]